MLSPPYIFLPSVANGAWTPEALQAYLLCLDKI